MTQEDKDSIQAIEGTAGFRVITGMMKAKMDKLKSVLEIKRDGLIAEQALARQLAYEVLEDFLSDLRFIEKPNKDNNKTYE